MTIYLDMDGTIADLYGVEGWLDDLEAKRTRPYAEAKVMHNMSALAKALNKAQRNGVQIGIISWLAKDSTAQYDQEVAEIKRKWLKKHLNSVNFDECLGENACFRKMFLLWDWEMLAFTHRTIKIKIGFIPIILAF